MSAISNNLQARFNTLANNLTLNDFATWAGENGSVKRRLVLNERQITGQNSQNSQDKLSDRQAKSNGNLTAENITARQVFLKVVMRECHADSVENLPYNVRVAMKLEDEGSHFWQRKDWDAGKALPLSARRVEAVSNAVKAYKADLDAKTKELNMGKNWLNEESHRDFWFGLDKNLRNQLLKKEAGESLKNLWDSYASKSDLESKTYFLLGINRYYSVCGKKADVPIPLGKFQVLNYNQTEAMNSPMGKAFLKQISKKSITYCKNSKLDQSHHPLARALESFVNDEGVLTIDWGKKGAEDKITLKGGGMSAGKLFVTDEDGSTSEIDLSNQLKNNGDQMKNLQDKLCKLTGLSDKELYILLSKSSTSGINHRGVSSGEDYMAAFNKQLSQNRRCASASGLFGDKGKFDCEAPKHETTITILGKRKLNVSQTIKYPVKKFGNTAKERSAVTYDHSAEHKFFLRYDYELPNKAVSGKAEQQEADFQKCSGVLSLPKITSAIGAS